jgi:hypothetical protein
MRNGLLLIGWLGFTTLASAEEAARAGHVTLDVWRQLPKEAFIHLLQPDEVAGLRGETTEHSVVPIDNLGLDTGRCTVRARCVVTAPQDGYYQFSLEAWGTQLVMLSDDATPARLRPLWRSSRLRQAVNYGPWRYFRKDQPRYLEIRHVYTQDSAPMTLGWTLSDGTKQSIPASCVTSYPVGPDDAKTDDGPNTEGRFAPLLKDKPGGSAITLDLKAAKALTDGWTTSQYVSTEHTVPKPKESTAGKLGLMCTYGGDLEFAFETKTEGYAVLSMDLQLNFWIHNFSHIRCEREIDGIRFSPETLGTRNGSFATFRCITPWLKAGGHKLRLHFKPLAPACSARLQAVSIQPITGNAVETVRQFFALENGFLAERGDGGFLRSPACVEVAATSSSEPVLTTGQRTIQMAPATSTSWWADVVLPESGAGLPLVTRSTAYRSEVKATARWVETHIDAHPELYLREGDALRLSAWPTDAVENQPGEAMVVLGGKQVLTPRGKPYIYRFEQAGEETVEARFTEAGATKVSLMKVHVLKRWSCETAGPMCSDKYYKITDEGCNPGSWLDGGDVVNCGQRPPGPENANPFWLVTPRDSGRWPMAARGGPNGPVLGTMAMTAVDVWTEVGRAHGPNNDIHKNEDLSQMGSMPYVLCMVTGLPAGWNIHYKLLERVGDQLQVFKPEDPAKPDEQTVIPWRMGVTACGQVWLKTPGKSQGSNCEVSLIKADAKPGTGR